MSDLGDYAMFLEIVDRGSLTAAAKSCGRSLQAVSRALARLEEEFGVQLINRTTRRLQATPAGINFHARVRAVIAGLESARAELRREHEDVSGSLRIGAPAYFASTYLTPLAADFMGLWPAVKIELVLSDRRADLLEQRLDLAVRVGALPDSTLYARSLASLRRVMFASPEWIERNGRPKDIAELAHLPCVVRTVGLAQGRWPVRVNGVTETIAVSGAFQANDAAICNQAVALGLGIGMAPLWQVRELLDANRVELLLAEFEPAPIPVHAVWSASTPPARTRLMIDALVERFAGQNW
jgi:DNA-binding transcriptional LysR family regulator